MANYCDFNPGLFRPFISKKVDVVPALADDWVMIPSEYARTGGFSLKSAKLNQEVADINLLRFLRFCAEQNLVIDSLKLQGTFIIGNDRSVYTEAMFKEWDEKFTKRTENIININEAIPGHQYRTPCGKTVIYMGFRYVSRIQFEKKSMNLTNYSKVSKIHFTADDLVRGYYDNTYSIENMKVKFTVDEGPVATPEKVDEMMEHFYAHNPEYVIFSKTMPKKDYQIGLVEMLPMPNERIRVLVAESYGKLYCADGRNGQSGRNGQTLGIIHVKTRFPAGGVFWSDAVFDRNTLTRIIPPHGYPWNKTIRPAHKLYRFGIV